MATVTVTFLMLNLSYSTFFVVAFDVSVDYFGLEYQTAYRQGAVSQYDARRSRLACCRLQRQVVVDGQHHPSNVHLHQHRSGN